MELTKIILRGRFQPSGCDQPFKTKRKVEPCLERMPWDATEALGEALSGIAVIAASG